jgi:hypothetical protein
MSATIREARDEMSALVAAAWVAGGLPLSSLVWDDVDAKPPSDGPWARVTIRHMTGDQATLGPPGQRKYERGGLLTVQAFAIPGGGLSSGPDIVKIMEDALRSGSTPSGVWFRKVRVNEMGRDGRWFATNVVAEFVYDEIG